MLIHNLLVTHYSHVPLILFIGFMNQIIEMQWKDTDLVSVGYAIMIMFLTMDSYLFVKYCTIRSRMHRLLSSIYDNSSINHIQIIA